MSQNTQIGFYHEKVDSNNFLFAQDPEMINLFEEEEIKLDIAQHIYDLRDSTGKTQEEFGELVGIDPVPALSLMTLKRQTMKVILL